MTPSLLTYITKPHFERESKQPPRPPLVRQRSKSIPWESTPRPFDKSNDDLFRGVDHVLLRNPLPATQAGPLTPPQPVLDTQSWERTLERSIKSIVSIKASHVRSFDTETAGSYTATGFVVDAKRGLVLSNRHVVSPAPIVAQAVLVNYEEVDLKPIYRDPVHDFGVLQFDPSKVKFMDLEEIPLSPERAKVGLDIRVVGNDAGEKLSILAGTLARLDRRAPFYGTGEYNDWNTFYIQAASGTSGGSSGSPVLDIHGHAVALNAGGASKASSSFYLPLDRVKRALKYIQDGLPVPRGTLQTEFEHIPYDEAHRLGLRSSVEQKIRKRFPQETGLLVVRQLLRSGPADGILMSGDILISCNGTFVSNFIDLFAVIDDSVNKDITLTISRASHLMQVTLKVQDLHSITPDCFVEVGGGVVNELSYQLAKSYGIPVGGVYVASSGHMLATASAWRKSVIVSVNNIPTPHLDDFINVMKTLPDGARVPIKYWTLSKAYKHKIMLMHVDKHWSPFRVAKRNDQTGLWEYQAVESTLTKFYQQPATASFPALDSSLKLAEILQPSIVHVDFNLPFLIDGISNTHYYGTGIVLSTNPPLVICDRDTVPMAIGDIHINFANSISLNGKLEFLHPFYNYALLSYDSSLIGDTPIKPIKMSKKSLRQGSSTTFIGLSGDQTLLMKHTTVSSTGNVGTRECSPPRWRSMNVETIKVDDSIASQGGVLVDETDGGVQALWFSFSSQNDSGKDVQFMSGLPVDVVQPMIEKYMAGDSSIRAVDAEFWTMGVSSARDLGVPANWIKKIESIEGSKHKFFYVLNLTDVLSPCASILKVGDVILQVNEEVVNSMADLNRLMDTEMVEMVVFRDMKELTLKVPTTRFAGMETERIIGWQGALIQEPYRAVREQVSRVPGGIYVSCTLYGSPASSALRPGVWITEVQGKPVTDLNSFIEAVKNMPTSPAYTPVSERSSISEPATPFAGNDDDDLFRSLEEDHDVVAEGYVRLKTVTRQEDTTIGIMKLDNHYWGLWQITADRSAPSGWVCENL
ncbi:hypothetical protein INT43_009096 [Umbelopsis isabellina]|uniref:PDZ domain-containing protein n=1 Tax=Mortierella isabellina TaxID=91625 RepID=A0A8H7PCN0_MORIS|nr:hypothetical protein INT43_009096 [Umbelopsis isabellina]